MESKNDWKDILTREWKKDFASLTNDEINLLISNIFYQLFMVEVEGIKIVSDQNDQGHQVIFQIHGEAYRDGDSIPNYLTENIEEEEE